MVRTVSDMFSGRFDCIYSESRERLCAGADLAIYLCQSEVTSHFSDETFVGDGHAPPEFFRNLGLGNGIACIS